MEVKAIDNGENVVTVGATNDARSIMLTSAAAIVADVIKVEGTLAETAKAWGHALFRAVYVDGLNMDAMIGDSKVAAGWNALASSDAGRKAKGRMEVYFSNARLVAEGWQGMEEAKRADILAGLASIHYIAGQIRKAKADAEKAAKKEAARVKEEQEAADAKAAAGDSAADTNVPDAAPSFADTLVTLAATVAAMSPEDFAANADAFALFMEAYDAKVNEAADAGVIEIRQAA